MRRSAILAILLGLSLVLTACRASTAETTVVIEPAAVPATTTSTSTSTTSTSTTSTSTTVVAAPEAFPVTVESDLGFVTVEVEPRRIVSLSATHTEMLYALGAQNQVVATDLTSNFPAAAQDTTKLDSFNFNIEEVVALEPDLVILAFDFQGETAALETLGIPFLLLGPPPTVEAAFSQLLNLGLAVGYGIEAEILTGQLADDMERVVAASVPFAGLTIFHEVDETLFSASSESFIGDLYVRLGLVNIADAAEVGGPFPQLSAEFIVDQNPEFIFLADANFGVTVESVAGRPGWETIRAVSSGNIVGLDGDIAGRWGPRTIELMESIWEAIEAKVPVP